LKGGKIIKICDFGATCDIRTRMTMDKGTPLYIAPEVLTSILKFIEVSFDF
jgi:serine/threonine protein kinase